MDVLKDSNLEDMEMARVAAKALHNLQKVPNAGKYWSDSLVERLDELTKSLGDDLDGIMVSSIIIFNLSRRSLPKKSSSRSPRSEIFSMRW